jgi:hypothetical protein
MSVCTADQQQAVGGGSGPDDGQGFIDVLGNAAAATTALQPVVQYDAAQDTALENEAVMIQTKVSGRAQLTSDPVDRLTSYVLCLIT